MEESATSAQTRVDHASLFSFVQDQLSTNPSDSKKFLMALNGIIALVFCFVLCAVLFFYKPEIAGALVSIATILIPSLSGIVMVYLGAQGAVEVKANGVLQKQSQDSAPKI